MKQRLTGQKQHYKSIEHIKKLNIVQRPRTNQGRQKSAAQYKFKNNMSITNKSQENMFSGFTSKVMSMGGDT